MGILETDTVRPPLLPLDDAPRAALADVLRTLGLVEPTGGRIGAATRAAANAAPAAGAVA
jgi:hypothetical protein